MTSSPLLANATLFYALDAFATSGPRLMGRQAAGEGFLRGFARHADVERFYCTVDRREDAGHFARTVRDLGRAEPIEWLLRAEPAGLVQSGALHVPDPNLSSHAWRRRHIDQRAYSITGITHTTASTRSMDLITGMLTAPIQEWDALICTSTVVRATVELLLDAQADFLAARLGATRFVRPQLPVIPLGVDTKAFAPDPALRAQWRQRLGIGEDEIAALFLGRLSYHAKAHPLPMYAGLEQAARATGRCVHLIQAGWFSNTSIEDAFKASAAEYCPSVRCHFLDGRAADVRRQIWQAADLFTSLSDNIQETFGLAPVEAMAAGLPSVVSDWDGYRDTIRQGIDGIRVSTMMPPAGLGEDLANRHAAGIDDYDNYCAFSSQFVAIDPQACAAAYAQLFANPPLRHRMGANARQRAVEEFDWELVVARYQRLWAELAERRRMGVESAQRLGGRSAHPARMDPFKLFASYPTDSLSSNHVIAATDATAPRAIDEFLQSPLFKFARTKLPSPEDLNRLLDQLKMSGASTMESAVANWPEQQRDRVARSLVWLAKLGLVRIDRPRNGSGQS